MAFSSARGSSNRAIRRAGARRSSKPPPTSTTRKSWRRSAKASANRWLASASPTFLRPSALPYAGGEQTAERPDTVGMIDERTRIRRADRAVTDEAEIAAQLDRAAIGVVATCLDRQPVIHSSSLL